MGIFNFAKKKKQIDKAQPEQRNLSKEEILKMMLETNNQKSPSEQFASGAVFDIFRQNRGSFFKAILNNDVLNAFIEAYNLFLTHPEVVGFSPSMVNSNNNDTSTQLWNADVFRLEQGGMALLYMPIENAALSARIVGIIFGGQKEGYYYCMLSKDENVPSVVFRNMAVFGIKKAGEVQGSGLELMNSFSNCIKSDFFS